MGGGEDGTELRTTMRCKGEEGEKEDGEGRGSRRKENMCDKAKVEKRRKRRLRTDSARHETHQDDDGTRHKGYGTVARVPGRAGNRGLNCRPKLIDN
jgi:hypothetical protein